MNEIMARTLSFGVSGVNGYPVHVEVFGINGIPGMEIIGLPDASVRESRDRVNAAIINSGKEMQPKRITIKMNTARLAGTTILSFIEMLISFLPGAINSRSLYPELGAMQ